MTTIGAFLQHKMTNMAVWLADSGGPAPMGALTCVQATTFAEILHADHADAIEERNFDALCKAAPPELKEVMDFLRSREDLLDKFWRYLKLFSDTVNSNE